MTSTIEHSETTDIARTPTSIRATAAYYAAFTALGLTAASLGPTLPGLAEHTRTHLGEISFLFTARSLGYLVGSLLGGRLYDRRAGHPVMASMLLAIGALLVIAPLTPLLWLLTGALLLVGLAEGAIDVGGNTLLVWVHRESVGPFMNALHFFFGAGAFLSPIIVAQAILLSGDITWAYWTLAVLMVPVAIFLLRLPSPTSLASHRDETAGKLNVPLVALTALFFFAYVGAEVSFGGWIFTYASERGLGSAATAAYLTSAFWGALTLGRLLSIPLAARLRPHAILLADLLGCLASVALIIVFPGSFAALVAGALGTGFSMASVFPTTISLAGRKMTITGQVTSLFFVGASLGGMTLPWLIGQLFEAYGPGTVMVTILVDLVVALGVYGILMSTRSVAQVSAP